MKVLHTEWSEGWGGQEIRILEEMKALRELGWEMELACMETSRIRVEAQAAGFPVHSLPFRHSLDLGTVWALCRIIRRRKIDLIHTHSSVDGYLGGWAGLLTRRPVVRSRHLSSEVRPGIKARFTYGILPDRVISSGRHIHDHLVNVCGCPPEKHVSIPAGADPHRFHPGVDGSRIRRELHWGEDLLVIGIVAVLRSWKGHAILLNAFERIFPHLPNARLLIVGDGPMRAQLTAQAAALSCAHAIHFTGHRTDVPELMKAMDVLVLPSLRNEATSQVLPQAMLVGTPVIASSAGGLTEVIQDGVRGRVVPPGNPEALAHALLDCFSTKEKTRSMAIEARRHALAELTFERQIQRTQAVYQSLLNPSQTPPPSIS